jgi:hypothetical protein
MMQVRVTYGAYSTVLNFNAPLTVAGVLRNYAALWNIPSTVYARVNGRSVAMSYKCHDQDRIEFHKAATSQSICSCCPQPTERVIDGVAYCYDHLQQFIDACSEHYWILDDTKVFVQPKDGRPVVRSFYYCSICAIAVVAKAGEAPEEAWINRHREKLLIIERQLTEET